MQQGDLGFVGFHNIGRPTTAKYVLVHKAHLFIGIMQRDRKFGVPCVRGNTGRGTTHVTLH